MSDFSGWQIAVLRRLGAPITAENVRALTAWHQAEGGGAAFNPLNTTQPAQGASSYNGVGVRNYTSAAQGVDATVRTLLNGHYGSIVQLLRSGKATAAQIGTAVAHSPWGTGSGVLRVLGSGPVATPASPKVAPAQHSSDPQVDALSAFSFQKLVGANMLQQAIATLTGQQSSPAEQSANLFALGTARRQLMAAHQAGPAPTTQQVAVHGGTDLPVQGKIIGTPHSGTHTLGNWESDNAVDIATPVGTPIRAMADGVIGPQFGSLGSSGRFEGLRLHLVMHGNEAYYAHLSKYAPGIKPGTHVKAGQIIGYSGEANGVAHLHFGLLHGNPLSMFQGG